MCTCEYIEVKAKKGTAKIVVTPCAECAVNMDEAKKHGELLREKMRTRLEKLEALLK